MSGASRAHNLICAQVIASLVSQLSDTECEVYPADMRVKIDDRTFTYPDVTVVCGGVELADGEFDNLMNPLIVIEVPSDSTEAYDRGEKFHHYRRLESMREYVLISQNTPRIEWYQRNDDGVWLFNVADGLQRDVTLRSIDAVLSLADVYRRVQFDAE